MQGSCFSEFTKKKLCPPPNHTLCGFSFCCPPPSFDQVFLQVQSPSLVVPDTRGMGHPTSGNGGTQHIFCWWALEVTHILQAAHIRHAALASQAHRLWPPGHRELQTRPQKPLVHRDEGEDSIFAVFPGRALGHVL